MGNKIKGKIITGLLLSVFLFGCSHQQLERGLSVYNHGHNYITADYWKSLLKYGEPVAEYKLKIMWTQDLENASPKREETGRWLFQVEKQGQSQTMLKLSGGREDSGVFQTILSWFNHISRRGNPEEKQHLYDWQKPTNSFDFKQPEPSQKGIYAQFSSESWRKDIFQQDSPLLFSLYSFNNSDGTGNSYALKDDNNPLNAAGISHPTSSFGYYYDAGNSPSYINPNYPFESALKISDKD